MLKKINFVKNVFNSNFKRLSSPYKVTFAATYKCDLQCRICRIWERRPAKNEMNLAAIEKTFRRLKNLSWLDLTGGEITLKDELLEIVRIILRNSKKIMIFHVSTNGQSPEKAFLLAEELLRPGLIPVINISVDGPEEINDRLRGGRGAYQRSLETFKEIKSLKKAHCYLSCTISDLNIDYIDEFLLGLKNDIPDFNFADLHFNLFHNSGHYYNNRYSGISCKAPLSLLKKYLSFCRRGNPVKRFLENGYIKGLSKYYRENEIPVKCQALSGSCFINPYGAVYPCGIYDEKIGELEDYDFDLNKLWNSGNSIAVRRGIEQRNCPGCWSPCEAYPAMLGNIAKIYGPGR